MAAGQSKYNFYPNLTRHVTSTTSGSELVSYSSDLGDDRPILILVHGYPQSSFIWRKVIPRLTSEASLFVPELPGYGISSPAKSSSPIDVGSALLEALRSVFKLSEASPRRLVLGGHDRGARICHRLAVSRAGFKHVTVMGAILMDIVPTKVQWGSFANPDTATGYFHWSLLANVELAVPMLKAYGGARWCRYAHVGSPDSKEGPAGSEVDGSVEIHAELFDKDGTLESTCEDYVAGAAPEYKRQEQDQKEGRKIDVPTLVLYSHQNLGVNLGLDVAEIWKDWIKPGVWYESVSLGDGVGHFVAEEGHAIVSDRILDFLKVHS